MQQVFNDSTVKCINRQCVSVCGCDHRTIVNNSSHPELTVTNDLLCNPQLDKTHPLLFSPSVPLSSMPSLSPFCLPSIPSQHMRVYHTAYPQTSVPPMSQHLLFSWNQLSLCLTLNSWSSCLGRGLEVNHAIATGFHNVSNLAFLIKVSETLICFLQETPSEVKSPWAQNGNPHRQSGWESGCGLLLRVASLGQLLKTLFARFSHLWNWIIVPISQRSEH